MMTNLPSVFIGLALLLATAGCNKASSTSPGQTTAPKATQAAAASTAAAKVSKIVFVGKEHPCDCTRKAIDAGWAALEKTLDTGVKLPVERLQIDTQGEKVEPYRTQKPIMALPAIYFVDGKNAVLELLQGEVTPEQIAGALQGR